MFLRLILAAAVLYSTVVCMVWLLAGGEIALLFLVGFGLVWLFDGLGHAPIIAVPTLAALLSFVLTLKFSVDRAVWLSAIAGLLPIIVFFGMAEVISYGAMRLSFWGLEQGFCMFGRQTFTASLIDFLEKTDFLFGDSFRFHHHAHAVLSDQTLLIWSYSELSFVANETGYPDHHKLPATCLSL